MNENNIIKNSRILITGGAGSIGSQLVKRLLQLDPISVRVYDSNETGLFYLSQDISDTRLRPLYGDIRDRDRLSLAMEDVDYVFHTAAMKHVPICEFNPFEAIHTNIIGTENVLIEAIQHNVKKVLFVSTDKAVNPVNVMGMTKLLAEKMIVNAASYRGLKQTSFCCVRFGNVLNTQGSILPILKKQIEQGGPVTITDPQMTRFCMTIDRAIDLIIKAIHLSIGGEIFIFKMPAVRIGLLAEMAIQYYGKKYSHFHPNLETKIIGKRPGEKNHEGLFSNSESDYIFENNELFLLLSQINHKLNTDIDYYEKLGFSKTAIIEYSSNNSYMLSEEEILEILETTENF
ncbi:UDP-N-acetylglucosamine 4,6-dehydratase [anaerobic digester metagenome]